MTAEDILSRELARRATMERTDGGGIKAHVLLGEHGIDGLGADGQSAEDDLVRNIVAWAARMAAEQ